MACRRVYCVLAATACMLLSAPPAAAFIISVDEFGDPLVPWTQTASGPRTHNGQPATLTWSIVPDGTTVNGLGSLGFQSGPSDLIEFMNDHYGGDPEITDLMQQNWFGLFADSFARWSELGGVTYIYEPADDGGVHDVGDGVLGVRGDIRIGGASVDGDGNILAFNYIPSAGSDMVLDTAEVDFFADPVFGEQRLRNTIMHEHGHGFGLLHVNSSTDRLLMEPTIEPLTIDGPQLDEVRAVHFFFGDQYEKSNGGQGNNTAGTATPLGEIDSNDSVAIGTDADVPTQAISLTATDFVSISNAMDEDFFSFSIEQPSHLGAALTPRGGEFNQSGGTDAFDASARSELTLEILGVDGETLLGTTDPEGEPTPGPGVAKTLSDVMLAYPGTYFAHITGAEDTIQLYELELSAEAFLPGDYDDNGIVDLADYVLLRDALASSAVLFNDITPDSVTQEDYDVWRSWFGETIATSTTAAGSSVVSSAVPEPGTLALLMTGLLSGLQRRRRRHSPRGIPEGTQC